MHVSEILRQWYALNKRDLPWRETCSPYHIWLSEIILQQTRVVQGLGYYNKFIGQYPRIEDLASASLDDVLKLWQGLGYYTRARNLHETAKLVATELNGVFPQTYSDLLRLKGIGKYTAAAIASFAFREPVAVVDGNVFRVLSRIFGIDLPVDTIQGKKVFYQKAAQILDQENPHIHNQAIMEFGALVCLPRNPQCQACPFSDICIALNSNKTDLLPVKSGKKPLRDRYFSYFFIISHGHTWLNKRGGRDIWHSLYEFPLIETPFRQNLDDLSALKEWHDIFGEGMVKTVSLVRYYKHQLTHQTIHCSFYQIVVTQDPPFAGHRPLKINACDLTRYAVPRLIEKYLADLKPELPV
jgi:A/G-specific adenine glycosylase